MFEWQAERSFLLLLEQAPSRQQGRHCMFLFMQAAFAAAVEHAYRLCESRLAGRLAPVFVA